jgi:hypothetical protein
VGGDEAGGVALGQGFDRLWFCEHAALPGEECIDPAAQVRPVCEFRSIVITDSV